MRNHGLSFLFCCLLPASAWAQQAALPVPIPAPAPAPLEVVRTNPESLPTAMPAPPPLPVVVPDKPPTIEFTTLRLMRDKGLISQDEFDSALRDISETAGPQAADSITLRLGRWSTTLYGFVQADIMYHSTQSFNDFAGNLQVARPGTFAGDHGRTQFSARDSRFGLRIQTPETRWLRASAVLEMDFLASGASVSPGGAPTAATEASFFNNPVLRFRHAYFKLETPIVDILFGHTWHLFGWQPNYIPTDVQWSGVVGELFSRSVQLRISKTIKTRPVNIELAVAGTRPPQRDSSTPEFEAGVRLSFNQWTAVHTGYMTLTGTAPASIGVSGDLRRFSLPEFSATPKATQDQIGLAIAVNAFLPLIRGTKEHKDNSLSLIGEFVTGQSINDLYVGLTGGVSSPALPGVNGAPGAAFAADVDAGLAVYDVNGELRLPHWMTFVVGAEYYVPHVGGRLGLFANYTRSKLLDSNLYANPAKTRDNESFYNIGAFVDVSSAVRLGVDGAYIDDVYADGVHAGTYLLQGSGFLFF